MNVASLNLQAKLEIVIPKAAQQLPADVGKQLLSLLTPEALFTMSAVVTVWAGSHFLGVGEIADVVLIIAGWLAVGGVALEVARKLINFSTITFQANSEKELDAAASELAQAITLVGVNTVLALLLKKKPGNTFKSSHRNTQMPKYSAEIGRKMNGPRTASAGWRYQPKIRFTDKLDAGRGSTNLWGDITLGRRFEKSHQTAEEATRSMLIALYHERVHSFIAPKFYLLREIRAFTRLSALNKSYILRYLEEALAETIGLMRAKGMSSRFIIDGFKFPLSQNYEITFTALRHEAAGILLGPVTVGGMMYNVYYGTQR